MDFRYVEEKKVDMEIEAKYRIPSAEIADEIWQNDIFGEVEEKNSREDLCLDAQYFDTEDYILMKNQIAYRIRKEGERIVAAIKWKGHSVDGLHTREEINVPIMNSEPDPDVFCECEMGRELKELIGSKRLSCILETKFNRKRFRIDTGTGIFEFSIDCGEIITKYESSPIQELEIEIFSGETDELVKIGEQLQERYGLIAEDESKYARGVKSIERNCL